MLTRSIKDQVPFRTSVQNPDNITYINLKGDDTNEKTKWKRKYF